MYVIEEVINSVKVKYRNNYKAINIINHIKELAE
jgi:hypothetical protein